MKFVIECEADSTLLETELKNPGSAFGKSWQTTVLPAFRALEGIKTVTDAKIENYQGKTINLAVPDRVHA